MPKIIYYWGSSEWVVESSEIWLCLKISLGAVSSHTRILKDHSVFYILAYIYFLCQFYVSFMSVLLFSINSYFYHISQYSEGFAYLIFYFHCSSGDCFYLWQILSCLLMTSSVCFIFFFYHLSGCMTCCLSIREIFSFNIARTGIWSSKNSFTCVCC